MNADTTKRLSEKAKDGVSSLISILFRFPSTPDLPPEKEFFSQTSGCLLVGREELPWTVISACAEGILISLRDGTREGGVAPSLENMNQVISRIRNVEAVLVTFFPERVGTILAFIVNKKGYLYPEEQRAGVVGSIFGLFDGLTHRSWRDSSRMKEMVLSFSRVFLTAIPTTFQSALRTEWAGELANLVGAAYRFRGGRDQQEAWCEDMITFTATFLGSFSSHNELTRQLELEVAHKAFSLLLPDMRVDLVEDIYDGLSAARLMVPSA